MTGYEYEVKCAKLLESKGFTKVSVTPGSGDQGVDIIAYKGGKKFGVQCKYYEGSVGNKAVQEVFAGAGFYGCDEKLVITNSTLTKPAMELAQKLGVQVWERVDAVYIQQNNADYIKRESSNKRTAEKQNERKRIMFQNKVTAEFEKWKAEYNHTAEHGPDMIQIEHPCKARRKILCKRYSTKVKNGAGKQGEFWPKSLVYRKPWRSERYARRHGVNASLAVVAY